MPSVVVRRRSVAPKIKIRMIERGINGTTIAKVLGVTPAAVSQVFLGHEKNPRIRKAIETATGFTAAELWES